MYKTTILLLFFVINSVTGLAQNDSSYLRFSDKYIADSIKTLSDYDKMLFYKKVCWNNRLYRPSAAKDYGIKALKLAQELGELEQEISLYNYLGVVHRNQNDYPVALDYYIKAEVIAKENNFLKERAYALNNVGEIYNRKENYFTAAEYMNNALELFIEINDDTGIAYCNKQLGMVMRNMKSDSLALNYFFKSLEIREKLEDSEGIASVCNVISEIYLSQNKLKKARFYILKSLKIEESSKNILGICSSYINIGIYYIKTDSLKLSENYFSKCYVLSQNYGFIDKSSQSSFYLSSIYSKQNRLSESLDYILIHKNLSDSLKKEESIVKITRLEMQQKYDKELKDREAAEFKKIQKVKMYNIVLGSVLLIFLIIALILYRVNLYKQKTNTALAEKNKKILVQQEKLQLYSNDLKELNHTKDKLFSIIAHDLKSPFNSLIGFSELLLHEAEDSNYKNVEQYAQIVLEASQVNYELLINLLEWARSQTGIIKFIPETILLRGFINDIISLVSNSAEQKNITINYEPTDLSIKADINMLNTILRNLLSNAIKFTHVGKSVYLNVEKSKRGVEFKVRDEGVGIEEKNIENLFKIGNHFSMPGTNKETGTGLGLILCHDFIEKHRGKLKVESVYGEGATFSFFIPDNN